MQKSTSKEKNNVDVRKSALYRKCGQEIQRLQINFQFVPLKQNKINKKNLRTLLSTNYLRVPVNCDYCNILFCHMFYR